MTGQMSAAFSMPNLCSSFEKNALVERMSRSRPSFCLIAVRARRSSIKMTTASLKGETGRSRTRERHGLQMLEGVSEGYFIAKAKWTIVLGRRR